MRTGVPLVVLMALACGGGDAPPDAVPAATPTPPVEEEAPQPPERVEATSAPKLAEPPSGPDPARLTDLEFRMKDWADAMADGTYVDGHIEGAHLRLEMTTPGELWVDHGQDGFGCSFTSRGGPHTWTLALQCDGERRDATWTWIGENQARTDVIRQGQTLDLAVPTVTMEQAQALGEPRRLARIVPHLAGRWTDGARVLEITAAGEASVNGEERKAYFDACEASGVPGWPSSETTPCVSIGEYGQQLMFALVDGGAALLSGCIDCEEPGMHTSFQVADESARWTRE